MKRLFAKIKMNSTQLSAVPTLDVVGAGSHRTAQSLASPKRRQAGASAIEFAFVFPILLGVFYGIFVYGFIFVLFQSVNFAAQEGARAAVASATGASTATQVAAAEAAAGTGTGGVLNFLSSDLQGRVTVMAMPGVSPGCPATATCPTIMVTVTMATTGIFPTLPLPFLGTGFPPLPAALVGTATGLTI